MFSRLNRKMSGTEQLFETNDDAYDEFDVVYREEVSLEENDEEEENEEENEGIVVKEEEDSETYYDALENGDQSAGNGK